MMSWKKMKQAIVSAEDKLDQQEEVMNVIEEEYTTPSDDGELVRNKIPIPCRTPMGDFIVPPGGKPLTSLGDSYPGPADYLPKAEPTKSAAPHFSIVGKPKNLDGKRYIPGPFEYNTSGDIKWKNKKITLKGRGKSYFDEQAERSITHLGKYRVEHKSFGREGPKFKMGIKASTAMCTGPANSLVQPVDTKGFYTPGPNYRPNSSYWGRGPKKSFGAKCKSKTSDGPGPGDYDAASTYRGPSHSFGMKLPEPVSVQQTVNKFSPAANTYDLGTTIGKSPAISIAGRPAERQEIHHGPSASTYYPDHRIYDKYKAKTLSYRWFENEEVKHPGPADYQVQHVNLRTSPRYTCRQRVKPSYPDSVEYNKGTDTENPGPGAYNPTRDFVKNDGPSFSFRQKLEPTVDPQRFPGPNAYETEKHAKPESKRQPAFSMAKRLEYPNSMRNNPGPGEYDPKSMKSERGKFTMTTRPKQKGTFINPGPNVYTLPDLITGKNKGVALKSRGSRYVYSGFRTTKLAEPRSLPVIAN